MDQGPRIGAIASRPSVLVVRPSSVDRGRRAAILVPAGLALGLGVSWLGASALQGFVFGVGVRDGVTFVAVPLVLVAVGFLASCLPARRATMVALREVLEGE